LRIETEALVVAVRGHGEHGAIVRALTPNDGLQAGYVRGGRSRRMRPVIVPGNRVQAEFRSRSPEQLAFLGVELVQSRAGSLREPLAAAGIDWACALTATALPEGQAYPRLYAGLDGLLGAIEAAPNARGWCAALVRFEMLLLAELGFGIERGPIDRLAPALTGGSALADWTAIREGLLLTGGLLERDLLTGRQSTILAARGRMMDRLSRVGS
jgi:DNA repair protein RecO (recombination protein O)